MHRSYRQSILELHKRDCIKIARKELLAIIDGLDSPLRRGIGICANDLRIGE